MKIIIVLLLLFTLSVVTVDTFAQNKNSVKELNFDLEVFYDESVGAFGYMKNGDVVIPAKYGFTDGFTSKGLARVRNQIKSVDCINQTNSLNMYMFNEGVDGFIDTLGNLIIPIEFGTIGRLDQDAVAEFTKGLKKTVTDTVGNTAVIRTEKYGLINDKGGIMLKPTYDYISPYYMWEPGSTKYIFKAVNYIYNSNGVIIDNVGFYLDGRGNVIAPMEKYDFFIPYGDHEIDIDTYYVEKSGKAGVLNNKFEVVIPLEYSVGNREDAQKALLKAYIQSIK